MALLLAGDVGGTKTILRLAKTTNPNPQAVDLQPLYEAQYASRDFTDLVPMVEAFLASSGLDRRPDRACFGIAGPVANNGTSHLTNLGWFLEIDRLIQALDIPNIALINDFAAVGYGVPVLEAKDLHWLQTVTADPAAPIAVIGAGTGLGEGFLIPTGQPGHYRAFSTEGGHTDFAARSALEWELHNYLQDKYQIDRVSVERVVSGQGVVGIYQFLRDRQPGHDHSAVAQAIRTWEQEAGRSEKSIDPGAVIAQAALESSDELCEQAMNLFVAAYGAEAGNLALKLLPYGGLYVAGGIAAKILPLLDRGQFLYHFGHKGRVSGLLENVPVAVVLNPQVGLLGAAVCAAQLSID
ncbi:MAG: glucokinase [Oscillatoriales cyanobacterium]|nr:MAG: glucokinase [Oscillatoriales cyanobacterium]